MGPSGRPVAAARRPQGPRSAARCRRAGTAPTADDCDLVLVLESPAGRSLPLRDIADAAEQDDRISQKQTVILTVIHLLHRVEVRGGVASGTTVLAITQARDLTLGSDDRRPQRVALACATPSASTRRSSGRWPG